MPRLAIGIFLAATLILMGQMVDAQSWRPPTDAQRCPSKWAPAISAGRPIT
jgi:hypothetical protein